MYHTLLSDKALQLLPMITDQTYMISGHVKVFSAQLQNYSNSITSSFWVKKQWYLLAWLFGAEEISTQGEKHQERDNEILIPLWKMAVSFTLAPHTVCPTIILSQLNVHPVTWRQNHFVEKQQTTDWNRSKWIRLREVYWNFNPNFFLWVYRNSQDWCHQRLDSPFITIMAYSISWVNVPLELAPVYIL